MPLEEKYFVFSMREDGILEPVIWFKTLKEAREERESWKKNFPDEEVYIGEVLE